MHMYNKKNAHPEKKSSVGPGLGLSRVWLHCPHEDESYTIASAPLRVHITLESKAVEKPTTFLSKERGQWLPPRLKPAPEPSNFFLRMCIFFVVHMHKHGILLVPEGVYTTQQTESS